MSIRRQFTGARAGGPAPRLFREPPGSYYASWRCRWRRWTCAIGLHRWMMGPFTIDGRWRDEEGVERPIPETFTPYVCGFGFPGCKATKRERQ